jgi:hypothetical protein
VLKTVSAETSTPLLPLLFREKKRGIKKASRTPKKRGKI